MGQIERGTANPSLAVIDAVAFALPSPPPNCSANITPSLPNPRARSSSSPEKGLNLEPTVALALISPTLVSLDYQRIAPRT
jgi:hypothetical protein